MNRQVYHQILWRLGIDVSDAGTSQTAARPDDGTSRGVSPSAAPTAALRAAYRRWFTLTVAEADGAPVDPLEVQALHQQIVRLTDEAGPAEADSIFADELQRFRSHTARCGLCGGSGHLNRRDSA
jgi:hypothetical protein